MSDNNTGRYANEDERQASINRANQMFAESQAAKYGEYGQERTAAINKLRQTIHDLENEPGLSPRQAVDNMERAKALKSKLDSLENTGTNVLEAQTRNGQIADEKAAFFSNIQQGLLSDEAANALAVDSAWQAVRFDPTIGVSRDMKSRQLQKLINGEGATDAQGNRYVRFSEGKSSTVYRAIVTPSGDYGFVMESRGSDTSNNGNGEYEAGND